MTEIINFLARELQRAMLEGQDAAQARVVAEAAVRAQFGGERIYIAALPKQQRAVQIAKLNAMATREIVAATGMSRQHAWRLRKLGR